MPSGPMRKQPTWYCACTSPSNVGSSCRHQRSPSLVGARSLKRAHNCARSDRMSIQDGSGFAPVDSTCFHPDVLNEMIMVFLCFVSTLCDHPLILPNNLCI